MGPQTFLSLREEGRSVDGEGRRREEREAPPTRPRGDVEKGRREYGELLSWLKSDCGLG
jgi:hypothetical protein